MERLAQQQKDLQATCSFAPSLNPKSHKIGRKNVGLVLPSSSRDKSDSCAGRDTGDLYDGQEKASSVESYINNTLSIFDRLSSIPTAAFAMKDPNLSGLGLGLGLGQKNSVTSHDQALRLNEGQNKPPSNAHTEVDTHTMTSCNSSVVSASMSLSTAGGVLDSRKYLQEMLLSVKEELELSQCTFVPKLTSTGPVIAYANKNVFSRLSEPC